ncbi:MAG: DUF1778 domain-containing protein [Methylophilaceae bacterium]|nr:DUF1778 domain-containing protein [Methylophilaceae bacterium]
MQTTTLKPRQARMELKTTVDMKDLLIQAATLDGLDLTSFVLGTAIEKARRVLNEHANIALNKKGQMMLVQLLRSQQQPTQAMQDLMVLPDFPARGATAKHDD